MSREVLILSRKFRESDRGYVERFMEDRGCQVIDAPISYPVDEEQLKGLVGTAGGIITGLEQITPAVFDAAPNLKVVSAGGVGYDHINLEAAARHNVVVANCAGCNNHAVSELAFGMMLNLARKIRGNDIAMRTEGWVSEGDLRDGGELWGKTLGIVGLGRVGKSSALLGKAFGMKVLANDISWDITFANQNGISYVPLDVLLRESDYVSMHVPLTEFTHEMIDEDAIDLMKPGAILINTARGPIVKESALVSALSAGRLAGAALDVFRVEPHPDNPYVEFDNVILTPHIGGSTREAFDRSLYLAMTNVCNVLNGMQAHSQVN
ncbi:MAG: phosphoglycerate dehydrogenase [Thermomicrobiales bacterium]